MPRVNTVQKARKPQRCGSCRKEIKPGEGYRHWSFRYGGKHVRCMDYACRPRQSDLTQSKMATVYAAIEGVEDFIAKGVEVTEEENGIRDLATMLTELAETVDEVRA